MIFHAQKDTMEFVTDVDWQESRKLLKAYFPLNVRSEFATFEISSGMLRRPIHANTSWDQARLEVHGHRFCDLSEASFGESVLTDYMYGYTVRD